MPPAQKHHWHISDEVVGATVAVQLILIYLKLRSSGSRTYCVTPSAVIGPTAPADGAVIQFVPSWDTSKAPSHCAPAPVRFAVMIMTEPFA